MKAITVQEYHNLRDSIFNDLVSCGVTEDSDENFKAFDEVLGNKLNVIW